MGVFTPDVKLEKLARRVFRNVSRNGPYVNFSCPMAPFNSVHKFKADNNPSAGARVNKDNSVIWNCFTCKNTGTLASLLRFLEPREKRDYSEYLNELEDIDTLPDFDLMWSTSSEDEKPEPLEVLNLYEEIDSFPIAQKYMTDRGISPTTTKKLGIYFSPEEPSHDPARPHPARIMFPVRDRHGVLYGWTGRALGDAKPKIKNTPGLMKECFILGMEHWQDDLPVIIVEGLFAFAHFHEITKGRYFPYNIGAIMGSEISQDQLMLLALWGRPVYCFLDNDPAGKAGVFGKPRQADWSEEKKQRERSKGMLFALKDQIPTFLPRWPEGIDDPDKLTYDLLFDMIMNSRMAI